MTSRIGRFTLRLVTASLLGACALVAPKVADACGGCFAPPIANTVVSYHRMILSVSSKETTLYDQIQYTGSPESFAWVLPIRGTVKVGLSADLVFAAIDQQTRTTLLPPPANCPAPPVCPSSERSVSAAGSSSDAGMSDNGVNVLKQETVGPYETVQLESKTPGALTGWLEDHGYNIPDDIEPLIAAYVNEGFDFLALKLVPGQGVTSMRPVRITATGAAPSLPLRMIAAGSGSSIGVTLWVVAEGKWEPQTFPSFTIPASDITWTWATYRSDYDQIRKTKLAELGGAAWEMESSIPLASNLITSLINSQASFQPSVSLPDGGFSQAGLYDPILDKDGKVLKSASEVQDEDMATLFQGRDASRVTRLRSDLPRASLATDLVLQAAANQVEISSFRQLTREADEPRCAVYEGCKYVGTKPRSEARNTAQNDCGTPGAFCGDGDGCSVKRVGASHPFETSVGSLFVMFASLRALRRRRVAPPKA